MGFFEKQQLLICDMSYKDIKNKPNVTRCDHEEAEGQTFQTRDKKLNIKWIKPSITERYSKQLHWLKCTGLGSDGFINASYVPVGGRVLPNMLLIYFLVQTAELGCFQR